MAEISLSIPEEKPVNTEIKRESELSVFSTIIIALSPDNLKKNS
jgi:hypothetical protein